MHIKITEKGGGWTLWAAETDDAAAPPLYTARSRTPKQILTLLAVILNEAPTIKVAPSEMARVQSAETSPVVSKANVSVALQAMLATLDGWIEGAYENHQAMAHRNENTGEECWRKFEPSDIRAMINDTAREFGVTEFVIDGIGTEDQVGS